MPTLAGPLQAITAAVIGVVLHLAGVFAYATWWPQDWPQSPDYSAIALTAVAAWLLIGKQRSVMQVLGLCAGVGLVIQALT